MDCSPPGSSVHGILQARILGWVAIRAMKGESKDEPVRDRGPACMHITCLERLYIFRDENHVPSATGCSVLDKIMYLKNIPQMIEFWDSKALF